MNKLKEINWVEIYNNYYIDKSLSLVKIAKILNCSMGTVYRNFTDRILKLRTIKETRPLLNIDLENHPNWQGGIRKDKGRIFRCVGKSKYVQESIYQYLKFHKLEKLPKGYILHHIDHDKLNNDINNLILMTRSEHTIHHNKNNTFNKNEVKNH